MAEPFPLTVRPAAEDDLPALRAVYSAARRSMAENGNPTQWGQTNPREALLLADIAAGRLFAVCAGARYTGLSRCSPGRNRPMR